MFSFYDAYKSPLHIWFYMIIIIVECLYPCLFRYIYMLMTMFGGGIMITLSLLPLMLVWKLGDSRIYIQRLLALSGQGFAFMPGSLESEKFLSHLIESSGRRDDGCCSVGSFVWPHCSIIHWTQTPAVQGWTVPHLLLALTLKTSILFKMETQLYGEREEPCYTRDRIVSGIATVGNTG